MPIPDFNILLTRTLLYYEIFEHPLTAKELYYLFPRNSMSRKEFAEHLDRSSREGVVALTDGYYQLGSNAKNLGELRRQRERLARKRMKIAKCMGFVIKQFPFVRGVFLSGDLSKGVAHKQSDIDFVIVTAPRRLWICRSILVLFKKVVLLNSRKYFCLNYYVTEDDLHLRDHNYFTATEVAHLKPLYNVGTFIRYMNANGWIKMYFPGFKVFAFADNEPQNGRGVLQWFFEFPFRGAWPERLDRSVMNSMKRIWQKRYPQFDAPTRDRIFRSTPTESCAYVGNFSDTVLEMFERKLASHPLH
jgi:hypothetical protein